MTGLTDFQDFKLRWRNLQVCPSLLFCAFLSLRILPFSPFIPSFLSPSPIHFLLPFTLLGALPNPAWKLRDRCWQTVFGAFWAENHCPLIALLTLICTSLGGVRRFHTVWIHYCDQKSRIRCINDLLLSSVWLALLFVWVLYSCFIWNMYYNAQCTRRPK